MPDANHLGRWAVDIPESAHNLAAAFWPGPLTLILKRHPAVSDAITGGQDTVGLRVPSHPLALPGTHLHLYGKLEARAGRKMGHLTVTGADVAGVRVVARQAAQLLGLPGLDALQ
ncbi:MAG: Sua5/YciO/YrdC/YwlC family protein [Polaromonas sp.]|nr:Sua5/YciO/YrdC/YwlC family protein [Polaromonas sp.]